MCDCGKPHCEGRDSFRLSIDNSIAKYGFSVVGVTDNPERPFEGFMYTVGLAGIGLPEIYLSGYSTTFHSMINILAKQMMDSGVVPQGLIDLGYKVATSGPTEDSRFFVQPVRDLDRMRADCVLQAVERFGRDKVQVVQLLWSDKVNLLPTEDGYNWKDFPQEIA